MTVYSFEIQKAIFSNFAPKIFLTLNSLVLPDALRLTRPYYPKPDKIKTMNANALQNLPPDAKLS